MINPYDECPSFDKCCCNICPLDPDMSSKNEVEGDGKCVAHKPTRLRIASKYLDLLPMGGLNLREFRNKKAWESKSPVEREKITERLRNALKTHKDKVLKGGLDG